MILPDIVAAGIYNSAVAVKNREITKNRKTTMFEIELPLASGGIFYIDSESAPINENLIICSKPAQMRHTRLPFRCYFVHMIVSDTELAEMLCALPSYITIDDCKPYRELFESLCEYYETAIKLDELIVQSLVLKLIYMLCKETKSRSVATGMGKGKDEVIERVIRYIKENMTADLSLESISKFARFSPIHFHNRFKAATGKTLRDFVEGKRIAKAVNLLIETELTLSEIAYECGFSSQAYFSYAFKKRMGVTPRQYARDFYSKYDK